MNQKKFKTVTVNFVLVVVIALFVAVNALLMMSSLHKGDEGLDYLKESINITLEQDEIDDMEGYGLIVSGIGYGLGMIAIVVLKLFFVFFPLVLALHMLLYAGIARLVYAPQGGRLLWYRILMGVVYFCMILLIALVFLYISMIPPFTKQIVFWIWEAGIVAVLVVNLRNTYSSRIRDLNEVSQEQG